MLQRRGLSSSSLYASHTAVTIPKCDVAVYDAQTAFIETQHCLHKTGFSLASFTNLYTFGDRAFSVSAPTL